MNFRSVFIYFFSLLFRQVGSTRVTSVKARITPVFVLFITTVSAQAAPLNLTQLRQATAEYLQQTYLESGALKVEINLGNFDSRLKLESCLTNVEYKLLDTLRLGGSVNTQLTCRQPSWVVLLPATAKVYRQIPVLSRRIAAGEAISASDVKLLTTDLSSYRFGFALSKDQVIGMSSKFAIDSDQAIRLSQLTEPTVIRRGDEVTLEASVGAIKVVGQGTAMSDGRLGQQIRVKNNQSLRFVMARVIGPGKVEGIL